MSVLIIERKSFKPEAVTPYLSSSGTEIRTSRDALKPERIASPGIRLLLASGFPIQMITVEGGNFTHLPETDATVTGFWGMYKATQTEPHLDGQREIGAIYTFGNNGKVLRKPFKEERGVTKPALFGIFEKPKIITSWSPDSNAPEDKILLYADLFRFLQSKITTTPYRIITGSFRPTVEIVNDSQTGRTVTLKYLEIKNYILP